MGAADAPGRGVDAGGGAAHFGSPERPRRHAEAADGSGRGGGDSGARAASRQLIYGEEEGEATAKLAVAVDLTGERWSGGGARRRRRRPPRRGRGEGEGGGSACDFTEKSVCFPGITNRSFAALICGLRV